MWIAAIYIRGADAPIAARVCAEGEDLLIQSAATGQVLERIPFEHLIDIPPELPSGFSSGLSSDAATARSSYDFTWSPEENKILINNNHDLRDAAWAWRLPARPRPLSRSRPFLWLALAVCGTVFLILLLPSLLLSISPQTESQLFSRARPLPLERLCSSTQGNLASEKLLARLNSTSAGVPVKLQYFRSDECSLFALPGGRIFVSYGLLKEVASANELAAIMAHELAHIERHDVLDSLLRDSLLIFFFRVLPGVLRGSVLEPSVLNFLLRTRFSEDQEKQATAVAGAILKQAHIPPDGFTTFVERIQGKGVFPSLLTDHPVGLATSSAGSSASSDPPSPPPLSDEEWVSLNKICD